ncbi:hypothetical protein ACHAXT_006530, partial [Thalassiosira profunda]
HQPSGEGQVKVIKVLKRQALHIMRYLLLPVVGAIATHHSVHAFQAAPPRRRSPLFASSDGDADGAAPTAESILDELHRSELTFRIVVIGNGAILETTSKLGPVCKSSVSPKSGERLLTFANEDQSFEFHVKVEQVSKIAFVANQRHVARFLGDDGAPICSLILADSSNGAEEWFDALVEKHGGEVQL